MEFINRPPYIKSKGALDAFQPIVKNGIPREADSRRDKKVIGTMAWEKFWEEELWKIHNGVQHGSVWIPGRYYYYLNYSVMSTVKFGNINPDLDDLHLELALLIEHCKKHGKNLMIPKARRKGISEATHKMVVDYGWRFFYSYKCGIASGKSDFIEGFVEKLRYGHMFLPPELYMGKLTDNDDEIVSGYIEKNSHGAWEEAGTMNSIYTKTIHADAAGFKGQYYNDIIVEEVGETPKFLEFWAGTRDAMSDGAGKQIGTAFVYGTGGDINKGSKAFKEAWSRNEKENFIDTNNFIRFVIPAQRFYFYGGNINKTRDLPVQSELLKKYKPYQLIGVEDTELALQDILKTREEKKNGPRKDYLEYLQNNPINEQEIFRKSVINDFNTRLLNDRIAHLDSLSHPLWTKYRMEYVKDKVTGQRKHPLEVEIIPLKKSDDQEVCVWISDGHTPQGHYSNRYSGGVDGYNVDTAKASKSLGAMCVLDRETKKPVAVICCRPPRKEVFYELCLKLAIYYKLHGNVLVDIASDAIVKHFENAGCYNLLADRPKKFESLGSEQSHPKGIRLTTYSRPLMVGYMQSHIEDHIDKIDFPDLLDQLGNYDVFEIGSDNDLADAYGIAIMQDISYEVRPRNDDESQIPDRWNIPQFVPDGQGGLKLQVHADMMKHIQQDSDLFGTMYGNLE